MAFDHKGADEAVADLKPEKVYTRWREQPLVAASIASIKETLSAQQEAALDTLLYDAFRSGHGYGGAGIALGLMTGLVEHIGKRKRSQLDEINDLMRR